MLLGFAVLLGGASGFILSALLIKRAWGFDPMESLIERA
jgi:hypothetical protein